MPVIGFAVTSNMFIYPMQVYQEVSTTEVVHRNADLELHLDNLPVDVHKKEIINF